jgi:hypothetical protein
VKSKKMELTRQIAGLLLIFSGLLLAGITTPSRIDLVAAQDANHLVYKSVFPPLLFAAIFAAGLLCLGIIREDIGALSWLACGGLGLLMWLPSDTPLLFGQYSGAAWRMSALAQTVTVLSLLQALWCFTQKRLRFQWKACAVLVGALVLSQAGAFLNWLVVRTMPAGAALKVLTKLAYALGGLAILPFLRKPRQMRASGWALLIAGSVCTLLGLVMLWTPGAEISKAIGNVHPALLWLAKEYGNLPLSGSVAAMGAYLLRRGSNQAVQPGEQHA